MSVPAAADRLERILAAAPPRLAAISEEAAGRSSGPDRWSPKEILGHLIDSAGNNHQRFVRAQLAPAVDWPGYEQENWVAVQQYRSESWADLVQLWLLFNRHLLHVMRCVRESALETPVSLRGANRVTLAHTMIDYVRHLEHHLGQILDPATF